MHQDFFLATKLQNAPKEKMQFYDTEQVSEPDSDVAELLELLDW
jgi:hypothetical protein